MLGKIFKYVLVVLLGMILGIGATVGAVYLIVAKTKVGTIKDYVPAVDQYIGDSLSDLTLLEAVQKLGDPSATIGTYTEYFPFLNDVLENLTQSETVAAFATVDLDKLKSLSFSQLGSNIGSVVSVTASLESLSSSMSFALPDLPVFTEKLSYVKVTNGEYEVTNNYYADKKSEIYYTETPAEEGAEATYAHAYDDAGALVEAAQGKDLFFRSIGILNLPVTDAISALSSVFGDVNEMTIGDLKTNFGVDVIGEDENSLIAKLIKPTDRINGLNEVETRIDDLHLVNDLGFENIDGTLLGEILPNDADRTVGALKTMAVDERVNNLKLGQIIEITETSSKIMRRLENVTVGGLDEEIKILTIGDVTEITETSSKIMRTLQNTKIEELDSTIKTLTIGDVMEITDASSKIMRKLQGTKIEELDGAIKNLTVADAVEVNGESSKILQTLQGTKIEELDGAIKNLKIGDVVDAGENKILQYLSGTLITNIGAGLNDMPLSVVLELDENGSSGNPILDALIADKSDPTTIDNIATKINALSVSDVYDTEAFVKVNGTGNAEYRYFERSGTEGAYVYTETEYTAGAELYQVKQDAGVWLIALYNKSDIGGQKTAYTEVSAQEKSLSKLATTLTSRLTGAETGIGNSTLQELFEVGFISVRPREGMRNMTLNGLIGTEI